MTDKSEHPPVPEAFAVLGLRPSLLRGLAEAKFTTPSEIQALLIPEALQGGDILGQARTGTGKTAAFGLPVLQRAEKGLATQALILVPTRELAVQVEEEIKRLGQYTPIRTVAVYGGQKIAAQMKYLKHGPEIVVGTPGRVIDLLDRRILTLENIKYVILDEVDRMLDIGFRDDIRNILSRVKGMKKRVPQDAREGAPQDEAAVGQSSDAGDDVQQPADDGRHQTIFVSATISEEIEKLARRYMVEPVKKLIAPGADEKPTVEKVEQYYFSVQPWDKYRLMRLLLEKENPDLAIIFCRTKRGAEKLAKKLHADGIECREIHGNLAQNKRDHVMKGFKGGKFDVLIATDLASRGIDVADISHIVNYDISEDPEVYVHRVGRTARMGKGGKAFTFVTKEQGDELTKVENLINMQIPQATLEGFEPRPAPADWTDFKPGEFPGASGGGQATVNRFQRPYGATASSSASTPATGEAGASEPIVLKGPPRTIGSKIPINRRHKRRR
ncbi:MAG TPA: DEAD/DEAH box helicase [Tepidisphaeraceae bacterium]|jgi:ATP-dependent RNA helicase DeaD|nr:DEAD/DEAH box helicase [Tepidisphaeraceae bacterium]